MFLGANNPPFKPQVTSYDFGAPISENGILTAKYYAIKEVISEVSNTQLYRGLYSYLFYLRRQALKMVNMKLIGECDDWLYAIVRCSLVTT